MINSQLKGELIKNGFRYSEYPFRVEDDFYTEDHNILQQDNAIDNIGEPDLATKMAITGFDFYEALEAGEASKFFEGFYPNILLEPLERSAEDVQQMTLTQIYDALEQKGHKAQEIMTACLAHHLQEAVDLTSVIDDYYDSIFYTHRSFRPRFESEKAAIKCGLSFFYYDTSLYLTLNGGGMDMIPKLDAYQALTVGTMPKMTRLLRNPSYFKNVVGEMIYGEIMETVIGKVETVIAERHLP